MSDTNDNLGKLVKKYCELRTEKARLAKNLKDDLVPIDERMTAIASALHTYFLANDIQSIKTKYGTPHFKQQERFTVSDRKALDAFVRENDAIDLFISKVSKDVYLELAEKGLEVPGVRYDRFKEIRVTGAE